MAVLDIANNGLDIYGQSIGGSTTTETKTVTTGTVRVDVVRLVHALVQHGAARRKCRTPSPIGFWQQASASSASSVMEWEREEAPGSSTTGEDPHPKGRSGKLLHRFT